MNGTGVLQDLTLGAAGYVLTSAGTASAPVWASKAHAMTSAEHTAGNWKVFYSNGSGAVVELPLGAANYVLSSAGTDAAPQWSALPVLVESDPVYSASAASSVTGTRIANWDTAYGWGNHASGGYWVLASTQLSGDVTGLYGATAVGDDSHAHTGATLSSIDISSDTNLSGDTEIVLTDDALSLGAGVARDSEVAAGYQPLNASLSAIAGGTWTGASSITTVGTLNTFALAAGHGVADASAKKIFEYEDALDTIVRSPSQASSRVNFEAFGNMQFFIDSDNNQTDRQFTWNTNTTSTAGGGTQLMYLAEGGNAYMRGPVGFGGAPDATEAIAKYPEGSGVTNGTRYGADGYAGNVHGLTGVGLVLQALGTDADGDNVAVKLKDAAGASYFYVLDSTGAVVGSWNSDGAISASNMTGGANPTASVNGTAVNGSATTFMRSDAAPPLADPFTPADGTQNITGGIATSTDVTAARHFIVAGDGTPTVSRGTPGVVGTGATVSISGRDNGGKVSIVTESTGWLNGTAGTVLSVDYANDFPTDSAVTIHSGHEDTNAYLGAWFYVESTNAGFSIKVPSGWSSPGPPLDMSWHYTVVGW